MIEAMSTAATINQLPPRKVEGLALAAYGNCLIKVWSGRALAPQIEALNAFADQHCEMWPQGATCLVIVQDGCPMPGAEERKNISAFYKRVAPRMQAIAQVAEGSSLWAVMARSVFTALTLMEKRPYPNQVFALPSEGIDWLSAHMKMRDPNVPPAEIAKGMIEYLSSIRS
jgi:hypothetical protein